MKKKIIYCSCFIGSRNLYETAQTITGNVKKATPEMMEETANTLISYYEELEE